MSTTHDEKFRAEYVENRAMFLRVGISEADYLSSRRVTEGLQSLNTAGGMIALHSDVPIEQRDVKDAGFIFQYLTEPLEVRRGISQEDYVRSRRIDEGLEVLQPRS